VAPAVVAPVVAPSPAEEVAPQETPRVAEAVTTPRPPRLDFKLVAKGGCVQEDVLRALEPLRPRLLACLTRFGQGDAPSASIAWVGVPGRGPIFAAEPKPDDKLQICLHEQINKISLTTLTSRCQSALSIKVSR
jgi:hypothetical protein